MTAKRWTIHYFESISGRCPVKDFIDDLEFHGRAKVIRTIELLEEFGPELSHPFVKHLRGKIWELRISSERILYFIFDRENIVLLHGFTKKTRKTPIREIVIAENRLQKILKGIQT